MRSDSCIRHDEGPESGSEKNVGSFLFSSEMLVNQDWSYRRKQESIILKLAKL